MKKFEFLEHTADLKFQAFGKTIEQVFENAAQALTRVITEDKIDARLEKEIEIKGDDLENLLYNFLEEFIFLIDSEDFLASEIKILSLNKKTNKIKAKLKGDNAGGCDIKTHVKAVTYNDMFVKYNKEDNKWICQVVLDV